LSRGATIECGCLLRFEGDVVDAKIVHHPAEVASAPYTSTDPPIRVRGGCGSANGATVGQFPIDENGALVGRRPRIRSGDQVPLSVINPDGPDQLGVVYGCSEEYMRIEVQVEAEAFHGLAAEVGAVLEQSCEIQ